MSVFVWVPLLIGILLRDLTLVVIMLSNDVRIELINIEVSDCKSKLEVWLIAMLIFIQAFQLLNFLILDSSKDLRDTIRCLDPFPDTVQFKQINKSHKQLKEDRTSLLEVKALKLYRDKTKNIRLCGCENVYPLSSSSSASLSSSSSSLTTTTTTTS